MTRKYISEIIGTFAMIFCGTGAMTINEVTNGNVTHVGIAITWGFIVMAMIYTFGATSGAHFNPAVTIALATANKFEWKQVTPYILAQCIGAILASGLLCYLFPTSEFLGGTLPSLDPIKAFIIELFLTYILMLTIIHIATSNAPTNILAGFVIGSVVLLEAMFAGPMTNASMNPARSLAPAIFSGHWEHQWLYMIAPPTGALLAIFTWKYTQPPKKPID